MKPSNSQALLSKWQRGGGFIEMLVALAILAIGLLGVMSLQTRGFTSNQRAIFSTEVSQLAYDMADRILAFGEQGADNGQYDGISTAAACGDATQVCNDHNEWRDIFDASSLPSADGEVAWDGAERSYEITIRWDNDRDGDAGRACLNGEGDLDCFRVTVRL